MKLLNNTVLGKNVFRKRKESSKDKCVTVEKGGIRKHISENRILPQCLLLYPICNLQFNL